MTPTERLADTLKRLGAVRVGSEFRANCPLCQPDETDPQRFRLLVSPGGSIPVVTFCFACCVPRDRERNRAVWDAICVARKLDRAFLASRWPSGEIRRLWASVTVTGGHGRELPPAADPDTLDAVYCALLDGLELTDRHRKWLARRGLDPDRALGLGYRSTPTDAGPTAAALRAEFGDLLDRVPGFTRHGLHCRSSAIFHPCRDTAGRVVALKQRLLDGKKGRLRLLSSAPFGGPRALSVAHCPLGVGSGNWTRLWITEGERKADVTFAKWEYPIVAIPGVSQWQSVFPLLDQLRPREIVLAFDLDEPGRRCTEQLAPVLCGRGYPVLVADWNGGKGIDDGHGIMVTRWSGATDRSAATGGSETTTALTPNIFSSLPRNGSGTDRRLADWEIVPFLRESGPLLRDQLNAFGPTVSALIKCGSVRMRKTPNGQVVWVDGN